MPTRTYTHAELTIKFPNGVPLTALLIASRSELKPGAKNHIIDELVEDMHRFLKK